MAFENDNEQNVSKVLSFFKAFFSFSRKASAESRVLRTGDRGERVEDLQRTLRVLELYDYPDRQGYFGSDTRTAVMNFQRINNIEISGTVDEDTMLALNKALDTVYPEIVFRRLMTLRTVGKDVKCLQRVLKSIGYYDKRPTGIFDENTYLAVCNFQNDYGLAVDGRVNSRLVNKINQVAASLRPFRVKTQEEMNPAVKVTIPPAPEEEKEDDPYRTDAIKVQWHVVNKAWTVGTVKRLTDISTGISFDLKRTGGNYHVDAEPATRKDTDALKKAFGGTWSWERRPVLMSLSCLTTAASICGMPHGEYEVVGNGVDGHFCVHFCESKDDGTMLPDPVHQKAIDEASKYTVG